MSLQNNTTALIEDTAQGWADAAENLCRDEQLWQKLALQEREHIMEEFSEKRTRNAALAVRKQHALCSIVPRGVNRFDYHSHEI